MRGTVRGVMGRRGGRGLVVLCAATLAFAPVAASAQATVTSRATTDGHDAVQQRAARSPIPGKGRFHSLARPGVAATSKLRARSQATLHLGGRAGLPRKGLRAVAVTLTAQTSGSTDIWAGPSAQRPMVPSLTMVKGQASSFAIVPVSSNGALHVWNGRHAATLKVTVTGWFSDTSENGTAGLLTRLAGRTVSSDAIAGGRSKTVQVAGKDDVPKTGAQALLVRATTTASKPGTVGLASSGSAAHKLTTLSYGKGTTTDLAIVRLASGHLVVSNGGSGRATVALQPLGWFSDGKNANQFGDVLGVTANPLHVLSARKVGTSGAVAYTAGSNGIPTVDSSTPTSLVLWRTEVTSASKSGALAVDPEGVSASGQLAMGLTKGRDTSGLVLAQPAATDRARTYTSAGTAKVSAEGYAWFGGGTVMADGLHVLTGATEAAEKAVSDNSVSFTGSPPALDDLGVGDVLASGVTDAAPSGFLRKVVSIDRSSGDTVVSTTRASLDDAIVRGTIATGADPPAAPTKRQVNSHRVDGDCGATGNPFGGTMFASCSATTGGIGLSATVEAGFNAGIGFDASFNDSLFDPVDLHVHAHAGAFVSAAVTSSASQSINVSKGTPEAFIGEFPTPGPGGIEIIWKVYFTLEVGISGTVVSEESYTARKDVGVSIDCTDDGGCDAKASGSSQASAEKVVAPLQGEGDATATLQDVLVARPYDDPQLAITLGAGPYLKAEASGCQITLSAGLQISLAVALKLWKDSPIGVTIGYDIPVGEPVVLKRIAVSNCAIWTGTLTYKAQRHFKSADGTLVLNSKTSSAMSIDGVKGAPPPLGGYTMSGSGSGAFVTKRTADWCGNGTQLVESDTLNWSGAVYNRDTDEEPVPIAIGWSGDGGKWYLDNFASNGQVEAKATETVDGYYRDINTGECKHSNETTDGHRLWGVDVFMMVDPPSSTLSGRLAFHLAKGSNTSTGSASFTDGDLHGTFTWNLTKHCLFGGSACTDTG